MIDTVKLAWSGTANGDLGKLRECASRSEPEDHFHSISNKEEGQFVGSIHPRVAL